MSAAAVVYRPARDSDMPFIADSWRRSFEGSPAVHGANREHYRGELNRAIQSLTGRKGTTTTVACDREDDDVLLGFACFTGTELHYVYVRADFRQMGIARGLTEAAQIATYTFRTLIGERRMRARLRGWEFTPRFTL